MIFIRCYYLVSTKFTKNLSLVDIVLWLFTLIIVFCLNGDFSQIWYIEARYFIISVYDCQFFCNIKPNENIVTIFLMIDFESPLKHSIFTLDKSNPNLLRNQTTWFSGMEMVGGHWKTYVGVGLEFPWALGYSVLPGIAYVLRVS